METPVSELAILYCLHHELVSREKSDLVSEYKDMNFIKYTVRSQLFPLRTCSNTFYRIVTVGDEPLVMLTLTLRHGTYL